MLDKRKGPGADGAGDPSKDDSAERPLDSKKDNRSKVLSDHRVSIDFLENLRPGGPWVLTAIDPALGKIETITAHNKIEVRDFIHLHDGKRNLHYSVNPTRRLTRRRRRRISPRSNISLSISIRGTTRARKMRRRATLRPSGPTRPKRQPSSTPVMAFKFC